MAIYTGHLFNHPITISVNVTVCLVIDIDYFSRIDADVGQSLVVASYYCNWFLDLSILGGSSTLLSRTMTTWG